ncbi:MAG TPA: LysR substrate-binding domain-containing protein, partial [Kiloniellaceae bacterium]|nr:LysR substrate-binding domain-containing protein [Kiloniellaceae bacterium]
EAAARLGSVSAAAKELNVTHGAISHQIRKLEAAMKVALLERGARRVRLTPHGAALLPSVTAAFGEIAAATARMTRPSTGGDLAISCVPALLSLWLVPRLARFTEQFPGIRLRLAGSNDPADIFDPDIDICIRYGQGNWGDCWVRHWSDLELFPVASPTLLNVRPLRSVRDLADHVILHADEGREWQTWLAAAKALDLGRGAHHFMSDARLAMEAALHGNGIALGDTMTASSLMARGNLVAPFDLAVPAVDAFYVACRNEVTAAPIVTVFIDWLFAARDEEDARGEQPWVARRPPRRGRK